MRLLRRLNQIPFFPTRYPLFSLLLLGVLIMSTAIIYMLWTPDRPKQYVHAPVGAYGYKTPRITGSTGSLYHQDISPTPDMAVTTLSPSPVPATTADPIPSLAVADGKVVIVATISPTCAGAQKDSGSCVDYYQGNLLIYKATNKSLVTTVATNAEGTAKLTLNPGTYIVKNEKKYGRDDQQFTFIVSKAGEAMVRYVIDTGIR